MAPYIPKNVLGEGFDQARFDAQSLFVLSCPGPEIHLQGVQRRMVLVVNFFIFLKLNCFTLFLV